MNLVPGIGPAPARIMLVGEAPGENEMRVGRPFVGASGQELDRMLHEAGIMRSECFVTNVARARPPGNKIDEWYSRNKKCPIDHPDWTYREGLWIHPIIASGLQILSQELSMVQPNVVVAFGNVALWALTGKFGIKSWRGSLLETSFFSRSLKVVPCYHPAYILRDWSARSISIQDLSRAAAEMATPTIEEPKYDFTIRPSWHTAKDEIERLRDLVEQAPTTISVDIETRAGHIACIGLAASAERAICIPLMDTTNPEGYWLLDEEVDLVRRLRLLLCHPNARIIGQNFIYDSQYIYRHWGFVPRFARDTMLGHHVQFTGLPKGLDYLSSMYCRKHIYWKGESKDWDPKVGEAQLWTYNCKDCVITYEVDQEVQRSVDKLGMRAQHDFQMGMFEPVLETMIRGVRVDLAERGRLALSLQTEIAARESYFLAVLGHPLNPRSPLQMKKLFYDDLGQKPILNRKTKEITLDDDALQTIARRTPVLRPLLRKIAEFRSLGVFLSTFVNAALGTDGRLHCSYNIAGTETLRLSSSKDAFGSGNNFQNIPGKRKKVGDSSPDDLELPNIRKMYIPDPGYEFFDADLDRADLQVVVAEAQDADLKLAMAKGIDLHCLSACEIFDIKGIPPEELVETHANYREHRKRITERRRHGTKEGVHATNYGCQARTLSTTIGISTAEAERFIARWFGAHPGIPRWHKRVEDQLQRFRMVENRYGFRRYYFDRVDGLLGEALAWVPQSTVAVTINKIWRLIYDEHKEIQVLLQVHDSLAGQVPAHLRDLCVRRILDCARRVVIPYEDPIIIPLGVKTSPISWGHCDD